MATGVTRSTGFVNGNLQKQVSGSGVVSRTFEVGTGTTVASGVYSPVTVSMNGVSGATDANQLLTASSTAGDHPSVATSGINALRDVNRYWTLAKSGTWTFTNYAPTFTFVSGDLDNASPVVNTAALIVRKFDTPTWSSPTTNSSSTATTATGTSFTSFGSDFAVGESGVGSFTVAGHPSPVTAGTTHSVTVTAKDTFGNTFTGYVGTVHLTSSDPRANLPANYTFTAIDAGVHTFNNVTFNSAGTQTITATDTLVGTATGAQSGIVVNKAPLTITANPKSKVYGAAEPTFDAAYSGLIAGDTAPATSPTCDVAGAHTAAGTYPIACSRRRRPELHVHLRRWPADGEPEGSVDHRRQPDEGIRRRGPDVHPHDGGSDER